MAGEIILTTKKLTKKFKTVAAVQDLDLSVQRGDIFGFLGPNGAGKSTTIRMILGLIKPTSGEITVFNRPFKWNRGSLLKRIGALVEKPSFYEYLSARRNLEIFAGMTSKNPDHKDIDRVLDIVALISRGNDKVRTYSQGMKQRLGIAQALLGEPELIILDEPTAGLDPEGIKEIRRLIIQLAQQGLTVFLSSHLLHEIEQMCSNMAIVNKGILVVQGNVEQLLKSGNAVFSIKIDRPSEAVEILKQKEWIDSIEISSEIITAKLNEDHVPFMNKLLVDSGFQIFAIQPRRSLEDYFLSLLGAENA